MGITGTGASHVVQVGLWLGDILHGLGCGARLDVDWTL